MRNEEKKEACIENTWEMKKRYKEERKRKRIYFRVRKKKGKWGNLWRGKS